MEVEMTEPVIICWNCGVENSLTESSPLIQAERKRIASEENGKARRLVETDLQQKDQHIAELEQVLQQRDEKLVEAQKQQADLIRKERDLDDAKREIELTVEKRVKACLPAEREKAEEPFKQKLREQDEQIASMGRVIDELKRKVEQGSQQLQGEAFEGEFRRQLRKWFPRDHIEAPPKGQSGGDVIQNVMNSSGQCCGPINWEFKCTKNWSDAWLSKARKDQRAANAAIAVIVSQARCPRARNAIDLIDGVWVVEPPYAMALAVALRESLIGIANARVAGEGQETKMEISYQYLIGPRFRHCIGAVVEKGAEMLSDVHRERMTAPRQLAKREQQIRGILEPIARMFGDLQGIIGSSLQEIESLQIPLIESPGQTEPPTKTNGGANAERQRHPGRLDDDMLSDDGRYSVDKS
jgi:hypothetical protein